MVPCITAGKSYRAQKVVHHQNTIASTNEQILGIFNVELNLISSRRPHLSLMRLKIYIFLKTNPCLN